MRSTSVAFAVLMLLLAAGCAPTSPPEPAGQAEAPLPLPPAPPRAPPRPRVAAAGAAQAVPEPAEPREEAAPHAEAEAAPDAQPVPHEAPQVEAALQRGLIAPPASQPTLASLAGMNESEVLGRFGPPLRAAAVGQGTRWTWDVEGCEMTMTLFPDVATRARRVLSTEISGPARAGLGEAGCLERLGQRRAGL